MRSIVHVVAVQLVNSHSLPLCVRVCMCFCVLELLLAWYQDHFQREEAKSSRENREYISTERSRGQLNFN